MMQTFALEAEKAFGSKGPNLDAPDISEKNHED